MLHKVAAHKNGIVKHAKQPAATVNPAANNIEAVQQA